MRRLWSAALRTGVVSALLGGGQALARGRATAFQLEPAKPPAVRRDVAVNVGIGEDALGQKDPARICGQNLDKPVSWALSEALKSHLAALGYATDPPDPAEEGLPQVTGTVRRCIQDRWAGPSSGLRTNLGVELRVQSYSREGGVLDIFSKIYDVTYPGGIESQELDKSPGELVVRALDRGLLQELRADKELHQALAQAWSERPQAQAEAGFAALRKRVAEGDKAASAGRVSEAFAHYMAARAEAPEAEAELILEKSARLAGRLQARPAVPEEATRLAVRAETFAKTDLPAALAEMERAVAIAPWWPEAHYNLGMMRKAAKDYAGAARGLQLYLLAAPRAKDAAQVKALLYELEALQEQAEKIAGMSGEWKFKGQNSGPQFAFEGNRFQVSVGGYPGPSYRFSGTFGDNRIEGNVTVSAHRLDAGTDYLCEVPEETVPFKGEISPSGQELTLRWVQTIWAAAGWGPKTSMVGFYKCTGTVPQSQSQRELNFVR